jgi:DNA helicase II / ATP-dependent DNA helicase PcrA
MLLVNALAGTGKTTTAMFGLGVKKPYGMKLSEEQNAIVKLMRSYKWVNCAAQAFNTTIATELRSRVPGGVEAATCNGFGHRAWLAHVGKSWMKPDGMKNRKLLKELAPHMNFQDQKIIGGDIDKLVGLCKSYLFNPVSDVVKLQWLATRFDIELTPQLTDYVQRIYLRGIEVGHELIDFNDQVFLPLQCGSKIPQFDGVLVDELQDLNVAKQMFAFRMAKDWVVGIGDVHQAIYGFAGSDADAMSNFGAEMVAKAVKYPFSQLPLTVTRRNPKEVVKLANKYVPELKAADNALDGIVGTTRESGYLEELVNDPHGRMILCRTNAPLMSLAFGLLARRRRCFIQGKDIGDGLKRDIEKTKETDIHKAVRKAIEAYEKKMADISSTDFPDEAKLETLRDKSMCVENLASDCDTVAEFGVKVDELFKDSGDSNDMQLSSVHKSKGLEHQIVNILKPSKLPMIFGKGKKQPDYQVQQEKNLAYVAYTRSMHTLISVVEDVESNSKKRGI